MNVYTKQHPYYCGIDLHARTMYMCILDKDGKKVYHKNCSCTPESFLKAIEPFHQDYVYPPEMRATRDLMRRRNHFVRKRAELISHIQNTTSQYNLDPLGALSRPHHRRDKNIVGPFPDSVVRLIVETDLTLINHYDPIIKNLDKQILSLAKGHDPVSLQLLRTIHGVGEVLSLTMLYEIHDITRFPSRGEFCSYARLVAGQKSSAGKVYGTTGKRIGNAHLRWAFSEAAVLFLRKNKDSERYYNRLINRHGKSKALSIIAKRLGITVYYMLKRQKSFNTNMFLNGAMNKAKT